MKKLTLLIILCFITVIARPQTSTLDKLIKFVNTPITDLTEQLISIEGWELDESKNVDSVITLQFHYQNVTLNIRKVKNFKNEVMIRCDKQGYENINKSLIALKPKLIDSKVNELGYIVKSYLGETYSYKVSIAPKSSFIIEIFDQEDLAKSQMDIKNYNSSNVDPLANNYAESRSGFGETPIALRKFSNLVVPKDDGKVTGKIAVRVKINKSGIVVDATAGVKGTTLNDQELWQKCKDAVIGAKLDQSDSAPDIQIGVVVFNFKVR